MHKKLNHNLIDPKDKNPDDILAERHELVLLFDCKDSNPNGDPDTGNMPRIQPDTLKGLVTDVCLKRKIRNFFALYNPDETLALPASAPTEGYHLFVREGAVIERMLNDPKIEEEAKEIFLKYQATGLIFDDKTWKKASEKSGSGQKKVHKSAGEAADAQEETTATGDQKKETSSGNPYAEYRDRALRDAICATYFDVRYFGQVVSTAGPLKGSFYGQVRGPIQITFAESLDKALQLDASITRCAVSSEEEAKKKDEDNRTMGRKYGIDYGLYRCSIHISPAFAAKTKFSYYDLDNFFFALKNMFVDDHAAGRHLRLVGLVDFQHTSALGNAPAHKLFALVKVQGIKNEDGKFKSSGSEFPQGLHDYHGKAPGGVEGYEPVPGYEAKNGDKVARITARKLVWEIPEMKEEAHDEKRI